MGRFKPDDTTKTPSNLISVKLGKVGCRIKVVCEKGHYEFTMRTIS